MSIKIIAEIGINHNGDVNLCEQIIDIAKDAGCDAVKFQKRDINIVYTKEFLDSPRDSPWGKTQRDQKTGLEFNLEQYKKINDHCNTIGIDWFASSWDLNSQKFLRKFDLKFNKIASAMIVYKDLLKLVAEEGKHTYISTGMSNYSDIDEAVNIFEKNNCPYTLFHCVSTYPCNDDDCNLNLIQTLKDRYGCEVGYSGHEFRLGTTVAAVYLGATILERHITLDRTMWGSDHLASVEPQGLIKLVSGVRELEIAFGDGVKRVTEGEIKSRNKLRGKQ